MEIFNKVTRIILILLVLLAVAMQVKLYITFLKNKEMLDSDPLVVSANRYDIDYCECFISDTRKIAFNKNHSITINTRKVSDFFPTLDGTS